MPLLFFFTNKGVSIMKNHKPLTFGDLAPALNNEDNAEIFLIKNGKKNSFMDMIRAGKVTQNEGYKYYVQSIRPKMMGMIPYLEIVLTDTLIYSNVLKDKEG